MEVLTPDEVIKSGKPGFYWWRMNKDFDWICVKVERSGDRWFTNGLLLNPRKGIERGGEYVGPIPFPNE
jgi:hypothetical protein